MAADSSVEVEGVLNACAGVAEAAVVARPCPVLGERSHAFVTVDDPSFVAEDLAAEGARRLADYEVLANFA